ncbi:unnamed protein product (macronuclear) [Paramecium tetraurelia]|uniref:Trichohyalin-plectin-homology domain-containing protein n=1 Tax=Paramecium tetraurelia TaxID=5888 RepID=A0BCT7_PARTE|nr:uncharacterized protein GSPATT00004448001 [Paramecium tetraurelia]CAK56354.1 unnamed protein product [Paramecium tetraurelia]|eukprot:XP_001423752.1 hypothetical protein (macronuclear) [Paramecium tetraurelia strain d4-2]
MQFQKQLLKNTLEEQQQFRQQQQFDQKRRAIEQEQQLLQESAKALEHDELQRKQIQRIKQRELSEAYEQSINQKKQNQNIIKQKQIQDEYNLVSQAQQYQEMQKQQKMLQQYQMKQIAQASMDDKMRKIMQQKEQQEQEKIKEQLNQRDEENRISEKQKQYRDYYRQVAEHQDRMQKNFAEKIGSDKQFQIDNMINRGIENVQYKEDMEAQQKKQSQIYNKQMMRDSLQKQIFEKEQSTKNQNGSQIMSNGFRSTENNQIDPSVHNPLLNPIPGYNQNPYLNQRSQLGTYGNQVLKMY